MALEHARGTLIEKKVATLQAGFLLAAFKTRVLQEPASLSRRLVQTSVIEQKRRLEVEMMIRDDLCAMLDELADLPLKVTAPDFVDETKIDLRPQVESDEEQLKDSPVQVYKPFQAK